MKMDMTYYKRYEPFFGTWYITKMLGEGSFGRVFEIERQDFGEIYKAALKIITVPQSESEVRSVMSSGMDKGHVTEYFEGVVREIVSEFVLMSKLKGNSHVVSYEDHQVIPHKGKRIGWDILIRMELLTPLLDYAENTKLTRKDIMKLGIDMCHALELCQKHNIIHRDIKPENIFVSENGNYKLGDFGIARTIEKTNSGMSKKGTYTYMAPEVYKGEKYGSSVDIYSLGVVLYRLLNKNRTLFLPPFPEKIKHSDIDKALIRRISGEVPPAPSGADGRLAEIVLKACSYNPKDRYSSPMQMRQELEAILYEPDKAKAIYPKGDNVDVAPNEYVSFSESTVNDFNHKDERTVSVFGDVIPNSIVEPERKVSTERIGTCQSCKVEISSNKSLCAECNSGKVHEPKKQPELQTQPTQEKNINKTFLIVAGALLGIVTVLVMVFLFPSSDTGDEIKKEYIIIQGVQYSTSLTALDLSEMSLTNEDIEPLKYMMHLERLGLWRNDINDVSPLKNLTNLEFLSLYHNQISDLSPLSNLTNLEELYLNHNQISDVSSLSNLTNLETLGLRGNQIREVSLLSNLTDLEHLDLSRNLIRDMSPLSNLTNLEHLDLSRNLIRDVSPLSNLIDLEQLDLSSNHIHDVNPLFNLINLKHLDLRWNYISDVNPLSNLTNLVNLRLENNQINDWSPVSHLETVSGRP